MKKYLKVILLIMVSNCNSMDCKNTSENTLSNGLYCEKYEKFINEFSILFDTLFSEELPLQLNSNFIIPTKYFEIFNELFYEQNLYNENINNNNDEQRKEDISNKFNNNKSNNEQGTNTINIKDDIIINNNITLSQFYYYISNNIKKLKVNILQKLYKAKSSISCNSNINEECPEDSKDNINESNNNIQPKYSKYIPNRHVLNKEEKEIIINSVNLLQRIVYNIEKGLQTLDIFCDKSIKKKLMNNCLDYQTNINTFYKKYC